MGWKLNKTIVMVGMMGAGKTAIGRGLAERIEAPFLDSDAEIEAAANMSIPEIFDRDGEAFFRARESEVLARLLSAPEKCVLSTGGGAFLSEENRRLISRVGVSVCLSADLDLIWARVRQKDTRPLLRTDDPYATLSALYAARAPIYAKADLTVEARADYSSATMVEQVLKTLLTRPDVLEQRNGGPDA